jgi:hypothetical protein
MVLDPNKRKATAEEIKEGMGDINGLARTSRLGVHEWEEGIASGPH